MPFDCMSHCPVCYLWNSYKHSTKLCPPATLFKCVLSYSLDLTVEYSWARNTAVFTDLWQDLGQDWYKAVDQHPLCVSKSWISIVMCYSFPDAAALGKGEEEAHIFQPEKSPSSKVLHSEGCVIPVWQEVLAAPFCLRVVTVLQVMSAPCSKVWLQYIR